MFAATQLHAQQTQATNATASNKTTITKVAVAYKDCINQNGIFWVNALGDVNLKFYTVPTLAAGGPNGYSYEWTFTFADASTTWSYDREPYIPVPCDNKIVHAYVKISSDSCYKEIDKSWNFGICGTAGSLQTTQPTTNKIKVTAQAVVRKEKIAKSK